MQERCFFVELCRSSSEPKTRIRAEGARCRHQWWIPLLIEALPLQDHRMITCVVRYVIDPDKVEEFERFARAWIALVDRSGGNHHGYFLPSEGASDEALALFSFDSLAAYEQYRALFGTDPDFIAADRIRDESRCVLRYERSFFRPLLEGQWPTTA